MELTQDQIQQLKSKGLTDDKISELAKQNGYTIPVQQSAPSFSAPKTLNYSQVSQLKAKGLTDEKIQILAEQNGYQLPKDNWATNLVRGITAPVVSTLARPFQAIAALGGASSEAIDKKTAELLPFYAKDGYLNTPKSGADLAKDIGRGIETVSLGIGVGGGAKAVTTGLKGAIWQGAKEGAKVGALSGGMMSFGQAIQESENQPADLAYQTLFGTVAGGVLGGTLGAITPIAVKGINYTKKLTDINQVNGELQKLNTEVFKPTPRQSEKWLQKGKDPMKTYTDIFGTDIPAVGKDNRFTKESINDFVGRVNDVYKPAAEGFNTILRNSPEVNSITTARNMAIENLDNYSLTPDTYNRAVAKIENEFTAIQKEAQKKGALLGDDSIPVWYSDNLKDRFWGATKNFGTEDATIANAVNSSIGHGFKDSIENSIDDINVRNYNKQLGDLIVLRDFLETKIGALAGTGGKMTRLTSRIAGSVIGSHGGPIGSLMGSITGDKLAQIMIDPAMQPYRWLITKKLQQLPQAEIMQLEREANAVIAQMYARRMETLALPPAKPLGTPGNPIITPNTQGTPNYRLSQGEPFLSTKEAAGGNQSLPLSKSESTPPSTTPTTITNNNAMSDSVPQKPEKASIPNKQGGFIQAGYKETGNLTTKILKDLEGKTTVSKQYITDATNRGDIKQAEKDLIRELLSREGNTVNVAEFADKVKAELLPLKINSSDTYKSGKMGVGNSSMLKEGSYTPKYENISLPQELKGKVSSYKENIYESPIATSAGDVHFNYHTKNYFGHTRVEDMADGQTRRVIEVQSDLYQKGRLEGELGDVRRNIKANEDGILNNLNMDTVKPYLAKREKEIAKLGQYNNPTAHFRMVREELRNAAQDGKTKLQFPTGETAMKIEGLGDFQHWYESVPRQAGRTARQFREEFTLTPEKLKVGKTVRQTAMEGLPSDDWVITDVLGEGKFKAVPSDIKRFDMEIMNDYSLYQLAKRKGLVDSSDALMAEKAFKDTDLRDAYNRKYSEEFDISGKIDTENPIYRFYEKDLQKYLSRYGGKRVVDDKGVSWVEVPIKKEMGDSPVEAFGKIGISPLTGGALATGALAAYSQFASKKKETK